MRNVVALFVAPMGCYFNLPNVDPWDESRDARTYAGGDPVVAHPPCARWCRLAGLVEARYGIKKHEDGGCFASALATVRRCGGVLEHPAFSDAWSVYGLARPPASGGWVRADDVGGWTCHVEQRWYGHRAKKATWLYAVRCDLPELQWGRGPQPEAWVSDCANHARGKVVERMSKRERAATPPEFREVLLTMARSVR